MFDHDYEDLMKRGTPDHPKTLNLAERLQVDIPYACGILEMLWHFCAKYTPRGDIGARSDDELLAYLRASAELRPRLIPTLIEARWLDTHPECRLVCHDWHDHCDPAVHMYLARNQQRFITGHEPKLTRLPKAERSLILKRRGKQPILPLVDLEEKFDQLYKAFPRKKNRERAWKRFLSLSPDDALCDAIAIGVMRYADEVKGTEEKYIAHFATWLNDKRWQDLPGVATTTPPRQQRLPDPPLEDAEPDEDIVRYAMGMSNEP